MIHSIVAPMRRLACASIVAAVVAACVPAPPPVTPPRQPDVTLPATYVPASWSDLPGFANDRIVDAWPAFLAGCRALANGERTAATWRAPCSAAEAVDGSNEQAVRAFFASHFRPYAIAYPDGSRDGLVTGYYEPSLAGSRVERDGFRVPLYGVPDDLLVVDIASQHPELRDRRVRGRVEGRRVVPYWSRADIERGRANASAKTLAWVADPLDAFFLQVQGSGRIALDDGSVMRVGYADQNGHPYRAIANVLIERGEMTLEQASMQSIRDWARRHPQRVAELLDHNPSYVFFRVVAPPVPGSLDASIDGPLGSLGVPLLSQRAVAVDARAVPLGTPVWLATSRPSDGAAIERLVMAQDTGGAIRGAVRADYFWGRGDAAASEAGRMRQRGRLWMLWPSDASPP